MAKAIIGAAVIDDILGLIALSITTDVVAGAISIPSIGKIVIISVVFVAGGAYIGMRYVSRLIEKIDESNLAGKYPEFVFIFAMMFAFFYAMCAEFVGLSAIVGAFIAGVSFVNVNLKRSKNVKEGAEYLQMIFAAIFFVSLGILADLHEITLSSLGFLIVLTVVAIITKVVGCGVPARLMGFCTKRQPYYRVWHGTPGRGRHDRRTDWTSTGYHWPGFVYCGDPSEPDHHPDYPNLLSQLALQGGVLHLPGSRPAEITRFLLSTQWNDWLDQTLLSIFLSLCREISHPCLKK